jgi:glycosyltransferase involved in cell wall biosynthesis
MKESTKPYLLYVGNIYPHKNTERMISAFKKLIQKNHLNYRLIIVGGNNADSAENIVFTGFIDDDKLDSLYKNAALYIFPSLYEGFGFSPLEAMARGVAIVSSNTSCMPEILGDATLYFDPLDTDDMAKKISKVLSDENLRNTLIEKGFERVKKYSWQKTAEETLEIYKNIPL